MSFKRLILLLLILFFSARSYAYQQIEFVNEFGRYDKQAKQHQLNGPRGIAVAGENIFIADAGAHRIVVLDQSGKTVSAWGSKGDKPGQFRAPQGVAVDEQGRIYVADTGNDRVQVFDPAGKFLRSFGAKGDGPREFDAPAGVFAQRGFLYVADTGNSRVQMLTTDGIFLSSIEVKAKKDEMREPVAVAVDLQNRIYVLDADAGKVRVFDHDGNQLSQFGVKGRGTEGFDNPRGLAVDGFGSIYVSDTGNCKLKKFDPQGKLVASLGSEGGGPGQFREAAGLAVGPKGRIYAVDAEKRTLQIFSCESGEAKLPQPASPPACVALSREIPGAVSALAVDKRLWAVVGDAITPPEVQAGRSIGAHGADPGFFRSPRSLAVDQEGKFWVADTGNDRVQKFSIEGALLQAFGRSGSGEGEFRSPGGIAISRKGNIFVADTGNKRVQVFNNKGMFLGLFGKPGRLAGQFSEPVDLAVDAAEHVYVVDRGNDRIAKFDSNGTLLWETGRTGSHNGEFSEPANIRVSPDDEVYVLDAGNSRVEVFDANGRFLRKFGCAGKGPGEFRSPQGLALDGSTRLYVGDRGNGRILAFTLRHTPAVPKELTAQARPNEIQLHWKANSESYAGQYEVYRSDSPDGPFKPLTAVNEPFLVDKGLPSNKAFFYRIASLAREGNESAASDVVSAVTPKLVPGMPKKARIEASEKEITLSWLPNTEPFVKGYRVYRTKQPSSGFELLGEVNRTVYTDKALSDDTFYYYQITAVGKEGDESRASEVVFASTPRASLTLPPLEIASVELNEIFAAAYKYYESHPIGKVVIRNNTDLPCPGVKVSFSVKDYMDFPTETEIPEIGPKQSVELEIKPVFSNRILEVTENTPLQSEIAATYYASGKAETVSRRFPVTLYERDAIRWDQKAKVGSFVTSRDPVVADFTRLAVRSYVGSCPNLPARIVYARAVYDALGVLGVSYLVDPTPFQEFSVNSAIVDYTQYPREVLNRKSGDCDDLSMLFAAAFENIGIETALVDVPGHVFVMFDTGVPEAERMTLGFPDELLVLHEGRVWIPVEMTMVGSSFTRAWQKGAEEYRDWSAKGKADIISIHKAWELFRPVTLPSADIKAGRVTSEEIEARFKDELEALGRQRLANLSVRYLEQLKKQPDDMDALAQFGILYAENGMYAEGLEQFQKMLALDKNNSLALNNIGNINLLQERLEDAKVAYEASLAAAPDDTGTMSNLTRVLLRLGKNEEARKLFQTAVSIDPRVLRQYGDLAAVLGITK